MDLKYATDKGKIFFFFRLNCKCGSFQYNPRRKSICISLVLKDIYQGDGLGSGSKKTEKEN